MEVSKLFGLKKAKSIRHSEVQKSVNQSTNKTKGLFLADFCIFMVKKTTVELHKRQIK